jgi:uncharacterized protein YehS (DUF1456 family)
MQQNDILRRLRYTFDLSDSEVIAIFRLGGLETNRDKISRWLRKDDDEGFQALKDIESAMFLNGFIIHKRGVKDGERPAPEEILTNNLVLRKLKIALNMKDGDVLEMMETDEFKVSKPELSAFFRNKDHKHYRECKDQYLRYFLSGVQKKFRP